MPLTIQAQVPNHFLSLFSSCPEVRFLNYNFISQARGSLENFPICKCDIIQLKNRNICERRRKSQDRHLELSSPIVAVSLSLIVVRVIMN